MAPEPAWETAAPPPRKGLSVFGKVLIGCGAAALCFVLAIGALAWVVFSKATRALDRGWVEIHKELEGLRTEHGARALYRDNPGLAQTYATEEEFIKSWSEWHGKLGEIPAQRPDLKEIIAGKGPGAVAVTSRDSGGRHTLTVRLRMNSGAILVVELENEKLRDLQVE